MRHSSHQRTGANFPRFPARLNHFEPASGARLKAATATDPDRFTRDSATCLLDPLRKKL